MTARGASARCAPGFFSFFSFFTRTESEPDMASTTNSSTAAAQLEENTASFEDENPIAGLACPDCGNRARFGLQTTMNITFTQDGWDAMNHQSEDDAFPGRVLDQQEGLRDEDPVVCMAGGFSSTCRRLGTIREFRIAGLSA